MAKSDPTETRTYDNPHKIWRSTHYTKNVVFNLISSFRYFKIYIIFSTVNPHEKNQTRAVCNINIYKYKTIKTPHKLV